MVAAERRWQEFVFLDPLRYVLSPLCLISCVLLLKRATRHRMVVSQQHFPVDLNRRVCATNVSTKLSISVNTCESFRPLLEAKLQATVGWIYTYFAMTEIFKYHVAQVASRWLTSSDIDRSTAAAVGTLVRPSGRRGYVKHMPSCTTYSSPRDRLVCPQKRLEPALHDLFVERGSWVLEVLGETNSSSHIGVLKEMVMVHDCWKYSTCTVANC